MKEDTQTGEKIPFKYKLFFGLSSFGSLTISGTYASLLTIFYQDYLGLSARWIGIASIAYAIWFAVSDLIVDFLSGRTRSSSKGSSWIRCGLVCRPCIARKKHAVP